MEKKIVTATFMSLRFYECDGWTKEELDECCLVGEFSSLYPPRFKYFALSSNSRYDVDKLTGKISKVRSKFQEQIDMPIEQLLTKMNG